MSAVLMQTDPLDHPVVPRGRAENGAGSLTLVREAEQAGVIEIHRTPTGREYISPRHYAALMQFVQRRQQRTLKTTG